MLRKILWTALVTGLTSIASGLAFRAAAAIWQRVTHEAPPKSALANLFVKGPMRKRILGLLHAPSA
jgi:hypothetical protein